MTTVFNTIVMPDSEKISGVLVEVDLIWNRRVQRVPTDDNSQSMVLGRYVTYTDDQGYWEVDLVPNSDIAPSDSVYRVTERIPPGKRPFTYYIDVPSEDTQQWIGDLLTSEPSYVA